MSSPAANKYAILYCSGSWMRYMLDFFIISPPVLLLAAAFFIGYLFAGRRDGKIAYFSVTAILYFVFLNFFAKNIRYAMLLDMPIRLFAVLAVTALTDKVCGKYARLAAWLIVSAIAVCDYAAFHNFFIIHKIYDPVSVLLLRARGGIF